MSFFNFSNSPSRAVSRRVSGRSVLESSGCSEREGRAPFCTETTLGRIKHIGSGPGAPVDSRHSMHDQCMAY